jgi:hypothetical protein
MHNCPCKNNHPTIVSSFKAYTVTHNMPKYKHNLSNHIFGMKHMPLILLGGLGGILDEMDDWFECEGGEIDILEHFDALD